jgi:hypothetical protein
VARLELVPPAEPSPAEKVRQRVKAMPKPEYVLQCPRCGCRTFKVEVTGAMLKSGKVTGGTKEHICSACDRKGERVVVA